jgi:serine protease Do
LQPGQAQEGNADVGKAEALSHAKALSSAFRHAAETAIPTVVTIRTRTRPVAIQGGQRGEGEENPFSGTPFEDLFNQEQQPQSGMGSGVIIDRAGIILTNNHVVSGADEVTVRLADGREYQGTDIKVDPQTDLAVIHIEGAEDLPVATLGDSDQLEIGDWVIAVGNPFELELTVSAGIISGKGRELGASQRSRYLQTDAAINPGNSGGPLLNLDGEVIGINTAIATNNGAYQGVGFAIPSNLAKWVTSQLIKRGSVERAYLGVRIDDVTAAFAEEFGVARNGGVLVSEVYPDTPASRAGFQDGDIITHFGGKKVNSRRDLQELVERMPVGDEQHATVVRDGTELEVLVTPEALPSDLSFARGPEQQPEQDGDDATGKPDEGFRSEELGLAVSDMSAEVAAGLGYEGFNGVLVTEVDPNGPAYEDELREGMLILRVGRQPVTTSEEFEQALEGKSVREGITLHVRTASGNTFISVQRN